jgi:hypothetical protein
MAGRLGVLVCVVALLSAAMANGIRTTPGTVVGPGAPDPVSVATTASTAAEVVPTPPVATAASTVSADQQQAPLDDPYKDSRRKVPNGPDPIHNRY